MDVSRLERRYQVHIKKIEIDPPFLNVRQRGWPFIGYTKNLLCSFRNVLTCTNNSVGNYPLDTW